MKYGFVRDFIAINKDDTPCVLIKFTTVDEFKVIFNFDGDSFYEASVYCELRVTCGMEVELFVVKEDS